MVLLSFLSLIGLAVAGADNELHTRNSHIHVRVNDKREYPQLPLAAPPHHDHLPLTPPYRPLAWGDFNVIHTTDTHGWLLGHQKSAWAEPNYSGDLGDFASFVTHMKQIATEKDVDLLLVDSGDLHDGTGLSDGYPLGGVDAHESNKFIERLPYDVMTIGNHELYAYADTYDMFTNFVPHMNGRYLSSNVNITVFNSDGEVVSVPVGDRYRKFTTMKGRKVTSLGVIFNFTGNAANTTVQPVANMVKEKWFAEAIAEEPDVFILIGHMPVSNDNWPVVSGAIRAVHPHTPIMIFGGHTHIRDCQQYDGRSMAMESGRYMETIGWMSANLGAGKGNTNNITFSRRYLDQNKVTYKYHTSKSHTPFDTLYGRSITHGLQKLAKDFNLDHLYGTAPQDYTMNQNPYPSSGNALTLFIAEAAPLVFAMNNTRAGIPHIIITDSGQLRFDIFEGPFTKNDQLTAVPYADSFMYIPNVKAAIANQVLSALNHKSSSMHSDLEKELRGRGEVETHYRGWVENMGKHQGVQTTDALKLTFGYVTTDGCPGAGDDTLHVPLPSYPVPDYISSNPPDVTSDTPIDLVFVEFIEKKMLSILNGLQNEIKYTSSDVSQYTPTLANAVLGLYAQAKWN